MIEAHHKRVAYNQTHACLGLPIWLQTKLTADKSPQKFLGQLFKRGTKCLSLTIDLEVSYRKPRVL